MLAVECVEPFRELTHIRAHCVCLPADASFKLLQGEQEGNAAGLKLGHRRCLTDDSIDRHIGLSYTASTA